MESIVLFITVLLVFLSFLGIVLITIMFKRIRIMNEEVLSLENQRKNSQIITKEKIIDWREYHRINLNKIKCNIIFKDFGTQKLNSLIEKYIEGEIHDISVGGVDGN